MAPRAWQHVTSQDIVPTFISCVITTDFAEETGGALFNIGALEIVNTVFAENTATIGGLAIQNLKSTSTALVLWNVTFDGNILGCPADTYSSTQYVSAVGTSPTYVRVFQQHV